MEAKARADIAQKLLHSTEACIRWKAHLLVDGESNRQSAAMFAREEMRASPLIQTLLSEQDESGRIPLHPYQKWRGAHWVLAMLAELDFPPGDPALSPLFEQVFTWLLSGHHTRAVKFIAGRARRCASQEGYALWAALKLGYADERCDELANRLVQWQWPDGGWNCDKRPEANTSSFHETWLPARALALHGRLRGRAESEQASRRAAEVFLKRRMLRRLSDGKLIDPEFTRLHYPCYWHYDVLCGLKTMAEAGFIKDERCHEALDLLEGKQLPEGGLPCEGVYYHTAPKTKSGRSLVRWGKPDPRRMDEFITADALFVLKAARPE